MDRLQGTDGIRRRVAPSTDAALQGLTPQEAFLQEGVITEAFLELYAYAYVSGLAGTPEVVVGWDPRDPDGRYTGAVVAGVRKAGASALVVGIFPTPGVALYQMWRGADAALMVTASHNFRDQNGVKIFHGPSALKLFPDEDRVLTGRVLAFDYAADVAPLDPAGEQTDVRAEAVEVFERFHLDPRNHWLREGETLGDFPLVVDPANGALSGIAAGVLRRLHGGEVIELNADTASGDVNRRSGVASLEGVPEITRDDLRFSEHRAVQETFARKGRAAVFDADGDRFYRLDYDPRSDRLLVLSGDETAVLQARLLAPPAPGTLFVNTVESDLNAARAAEEMGFVPVLTGVGDKWVLRHAAQDPQSYGIGSEETGHNISRGVLKTKDGREVPVFLGNGLKSALNTFAATRGMEPHESRHPFEPGFKRTFYVYYTLKELFTRGSDVFESCADVISAACGGGPLGNVERIEFDEEPDMLYLSVAGAGGTRRAGIFVRNSGTEEKTGVNVRGSRADAEALTAVGEAALIHLAAAMKDSGHAMARAERAVLEALGSGPLEVDELPVPEGVHKERLLQEMANKERVIELVARRRYARTSLGERMLEAWS
ncbi:MAG: hypothetical protein O7C98_09050 [Planctomycetota bacterium]|nr:hypothetical protein [Planctomycetota bacterium]